MNDEKLHEITYAPTIIDRLTRDEIEEAANLEVMDYFSSVMRAKVLACREWLANNPQGLTREEFDALPDGSVVKVRDVEYIMFNGCVWWRTIGGNVRSAVLEDEDIRDMTVVSTPAAPTLDDVDVVLSDAGWIWKHDGYGWQRLVPDGRQFRSVPTCELENQVGPLTPLLPGPQIGGEA